MTLTTFALLGVAALLVGFAKTAIGGVASISVAVFAAVLPARESTGVLLPLLMVGDVVAVASYRAHADWRVLVRLFPSVGVGIVAGTVFVAHVDDDVMRRTIGAVLVVLVGVHLWTRRRPAPPAASTRLRRHALAAAFGLLAGFTTMVANAGGPVMSMYLLAARFPVHQFLGTAAWFFLAVNVAKVPFSVGLGLITVPSLTLDLVLAPAVVVGALVGRRVARHIAQGLFDRLVLVLTVVSSVYLLL